MSRTLNSLPATPVASRNPFTAHPATVGETYWQHMAMSLGFAIRLLGAGLAALVHAFLPFLFETTGSRAIDQLHRAMVTHRRRRHAPDGVQP